MGRTWSHPGRRPTVRHAVGNGLGASDGAHHGTPSSTAHHLQGRALSALDVIFMRRSVRAYAAQALDEPTIRSLLDAAVQARPPSHAEPWAFVVVQDRAILKRISDRAKGSWVNEAGHYRDCHPHRGVDARMASAFAELTHEPGVQRVL